MRILHSVAPAEFGGLEEVVLQLAGGLIGRGHQVAVAAVFTGEERTHPFVDSLETRGIEVYPRFLPARRYRQEVAAVRELLDTVKPDVLHTHGYRPDVLHSRAARDAGIPVVTTLHGFVGGGFKNRFYEWLQLRSCRSVDAVVAVSRPMAGMLRARGVPRERIHVIPNAWEAHHRPMGGTAARTALGVPPAPFHVGWVGRLGREKGPDVLLDALATLKDLDLHVSILGDGRLRAEMEERADALVRVKVTFHGAVSEASRLFPAFDVLVLSSRTEGTPMVLFEAMEAGVPILATAVGGVPDVVDAETAVLVPPKDPVALAEALRALHEDPEGAAERAGRARRRLHERFAPGPWVRRYEAVYAAVARSPGMLSER